MRDPCFLSVCCRFGRRINAALTEAHLLSAKDWDHHLRGLRRGWFIKCEVAGPKITPPSLHSGVLRAVARRGFPGIPRAYPRQLLRRALIHGGVVIQTLVGAEMDR